MKFKKLLSLLAACAMAATALLGSVPMAASAIGGNAGPINWDITE